MAKGIKITIILIVTTLAIVIGSYMVYLYLFFKIDPPIKEYNMSCDLSALKKSVRLTVEGSSEVEILKETTIGRGTNRAEVIDVEFSNPGYIFNLRLENIKKFYGPKEKSKISVILITRLSDGKIFSKAEGDLTEADIIFFEKHFLSKLCTVMAVGD
ncbi:hypothetical protein [Pedobacter miscanthi]|uniref:hypothetical protein n=1 Tax=Pedobacter miscanthi TaxID=2259170 RepID=UPI00292F475E|nr:hypothetical protein [Pedobacter miscanthi]